MSAHDYNDHDVRDALDKGKIKLQKVRLIIAIAIAIIVAHLEDLLVPCAIDRGDLGGLLMVAYPLVLGWIGVARTVTRRE